MSEHIIAKTINSLAIDNLRLAWEALDVPSVTDLPRKSSLSLLRNHHRFSYVKFQYRFRSYLRLGSSQRN